MAKEVHVSLDNPSHSQIEKEFILVAIGASAGGLAPLEELLSYIKTDPNLSFVVIQHLPENHKSMMQVLLSRKTHIPIEMANHGVEIKAGNIYIMPPGKILSIKGRKFQVRKKGESQILGYPIDRFFESMSEEFEGNSVGIILSGTGSDGSKGIRRLKEKEGLVIVQSLDSAQFDSMPRNALASGMVDLELPVGEMVGQVEKFVQHKRSLEEEGTGNTFGLNHIISIIKLLKEKKGVDFTKYKKDFIFRRILRNLQLKPHNNISEYFEVLQRDETELSELFQNLLVGLTQFYRNPFSFEKLKEEVVPALIQQSKGQAIRLWVVGCSTGEEAYSLAMLLCEYMDTHELQFPVKIFATDINPRSLEIAIEGKYSEAIERDLPPEYLHKYFTQKFNGYVVNRRLKEMIVFTKHNVIEDIPFNQLDLISCRNVLIYFQLQIQDQVLAAFNFALKSKGYLWLGESESLEGHKEIFSPIDRKARIFSLICSNALKNQEQRPAILQSSQDIIYPQTRPSRQYSTRLKLLEIACNSMISEHGGAAILVNEKIELIRYFGEANKYLFIPNEPGSWNLLKMVNIEVAALINSGIRKLNEQEKTVQIPAVTFNGSSERKISNLSIHRIDHHSLEEIVYMVFIHDRLPQNVKQSSEIEENWIDNSLSERIADLEQELTLNRENLHSTIEELQSSNEELMTANEELQGTNEELQSVNEELYTINAEYQKTIEIISNLNNDLDNLLKHTQIGILYLDRNLNVRRFNSAMEKEIYLTKPDIGRPISHFSSQLNYPGFEEDVLKVMSKSMEVEKEITSKNGSWYIFKIMPYETESEIPSGVICTMVDVSRIKGVERIKELGAANHDLERKNQKLEKKLQLLKDKLATKEDELNQFARLSNSTFLKLDKHNKVESSVIGSSIFRKEEDKDIEKNRSLASFLNENNRLQFVEKLIELEHKGFKEIETLSLIEGNENNPKNLELRISPASNESRIIGLFDKSPIIQLEEKLKREEKLKKLIAAKLPDGFVVIYDTNLECMFAEGASPWLCVPGKPLRSEIEKENILIDQAGKQALNGKNKEIEFQREGEAFTANFFPVSSAENGISAGLIIGQKITDLKKAQRDLQSRLSDMEQFAYSVSHDLKTPLRSIVSFSQLLQKRYTEVLDKQAEEYLNYIVDNTKSMTELINGLLNYAKLGSENKKADLIQTNRIVPQVIKRLEGIIKEQGVTIELDDLPAAVGLPAQISQLFQNLIENGIKFNNSKEKVIKVRGIRTGNWVRFEVEDNGIGIKKEYQDQIFEVFKHLNTRDKYEGSGIGLSVCKRIVENMKGRIWVESEKGKGSVFFFTLPAASKNI